MAVGVVDALEMVEIDQRDRAGGPAARRAGDFLIQHAHDAAAVERPGKLVELGNGLRPQEEIQAHGKQALLSALKTFAQALSVLKGNLTLRVRYAFAA